jgi:hypothetical protein
MDNVKDNPENTFNEAPVNETDLNVDEERQIIVHCTTDLRDSPAGKIRFCKPLFLIDPITGYKSNLLFAYNIAFKPYWTKTPGHSYYKFTLVFGELPDGCRMFDLIEVEYGFGILDIEGIPRNKEDIYNVIID